MVSDRLLQAWSCAAQDCVSPHPPLPQSSSVLTRQGTQTIPTGSFGLDSTSSELLLPPPSLAVSPVLITPQPKRPPIVSSACEVGPLRLHNHRGRCYPEERTTTAASPAALRPFSSGQPPLQLVDSKIEVTQHVRKLTPSPDTRQELSSGFSGSVSSGMSAAGHAPSSGTPGWTNLLHLGRPTDASRGIINPTDGEPSLFYPAVGHSHLG